MCIGGGVNTRSDSFTDFQSLKKIEYTSSFIGNGCTKVGYLFRELYDTIVSNLIRLWPYAFTLSLDFGLGMCFCIFLGLRRNFASFFLNKSIECSHLGCRSDNNL